MWHLEKEVITNTQSGFKKNRSTTDNLAKLENDIHNAIHNKNDTILVYFDLQKVHDSAWRYVVLRNLHYYGLRGNMLQFIRNFFSGKTTES